METCRGVEPRGRRFADSAEHQIDTSWCARPELNRVLLSGTQACGRLHLGREKGASVRVRSGSDGLEDRHAANYTSLAGLHPQRLVWVSIPSPPLDRRMSTPADSRGIDVSLLSACGATCSAQRADEAGLTSRDLRALGASRTRFASA